MLARIKKFFTRNPQPASGIQKAKKVIPTLSPTAKKWITGAGLVGGLFLGPSFITGWALKTVGLKALGLLVTTLSGVGIAATLAHLPEILVTVVNTFCYPFVGDVLTTPQQLHMQQQAQVAQQQQARQNALDKEKNEQNASAVGLGNMFNNLQTSTHHLQQQEKQMATQAQQATVQHTSTQTDAANASTATASAPASILIHTPNSFMPGQQSPPSSPTANASEMRQRMGFSNDSSS